MAGTKAGGEAAARTNKTKYGDDFYAKIGRQGGRRGHTGGFYVNRELAAIAGRKGGQNSRRPKAQFCKQGHALTPNNVYVTPNGGRRCMTCYQATLATRREALRAEER